MNSLPTRAVPLIMALVLPIAGGCDVPVNPRVDTPDFAAFIEGTVRIDVEGGVPGGPTLLFRYDCEVPPPPLGAGEPLDFLIIDASHFEDGRAGFVFPGVEPRSCSLIEGFVDRDFDFHYATSVTAQMTGGDIQIPPVTVEVPTSEEGADRLSPESALILRANILVEFDRPAFRIQPSAPLGAEETDELPGFQLGEADEGATQPLYLSLETTEFLSPLVDVTDPVFSIVFEADEDGDGAPDDLNGDGLPDILWPRVFAQRLDPTDPSGMSAQEPRVLLPGMVLPLNPSDPANPETNLVAAAVRAGHVFDGGTEFPVQRIDVVVLGQILISEDPIQLHSLDHAAGAGMEVTGRYRLVVMNANGQMWMVPNELASYGFIQQAGFLEVLPVEPGPETSESSPR